MQWPLPGENWIISMNLNMFATRMFMLGFASSPPTYTSRACNAGMACESKNKSNDLGYCSHE